MSTANLYIISAPSGAGKTSLVKRLINELDSLTVSVSHTTRTQRPGEVHGQDYYFISQTGFQTMLQNQAFLEHAQVFDNYYGTALQTVTDHLKHGTDVILEIDWQGAQQVRANLPDSSSIFILPPSTEALEQRLTSRGQDSEETIQRRMRDAAKEMSHYHEYDYLVVNDEFETALLQLKSIIIANRCRKNYQLENLQQVLSQCLN